MRVISGSARGCKLKSVEGLNTRPTTDRIKETLFNIISQDLYDCVFLDLFSGTGAIGIEALSRGANKAYFVDNNKQALAVIEYNLNHTKLKENSIILKTDVLSALNSLKGQKFDIIFMDPPYDSVLKCDVMKKIRSLNLLSETGFVIIEQSSADENNSYDGFRVFKTKEYRTTTLLFLDEMEIENA